MRGVTSRMVGIGIGVTLMSKIWVELQWGQPVAGVWVVGPWKVFLQAMHFQGMVGAGRFMVRMRCSFSGARETEEVDDFWILGEVVVEFGEGEGFELVDGGGGDAGA